MAVPINWVHLKHLTSSGLTRESLAPRHRPDWDRAILKVASCTGFVQVLADKHVNWCKFRGAKTLEFVAQFVAVI